MGFSEGETDAKDADSSRDSEQSGQVLGPVAMLEDEGEAVLLEEYSLELSLHLDLLLSGEPLRPLF